MGRMIKFSGLILVFLLTLINSAFGQSTSITVELRDSLTSSIYLVPSGETADVICQDEDYTTVFSDSIFSGSSSTSLMVSNADKYFVCQVEGLSSYSTGPGWAYVPNASTATITIFVTTPDATLNVQFVDSSGSAVSVTNSGQVVCYDYAWVYTIPADVSASATSVTVNLVGGTCYTCIAQGAFGAVTPIEDAFVCIDPSDNLTNSIEFATLDSQITLSFVNESGTSFSLPSGASGSVVCSSSSGKQTFSQSVNDGESTAQLNVVGGDLYSCSYIGADSILSEYAYFYVDPSSTTGSNLTLIPLNSTVNVRFFTNLGSSLNVPTSGAPYVSCHPIDGQSGIFGKAPSFGATDVQILVRSGEIQCSAYGFGGYSLPDSGSVTISDNTTVNLDLTFFPHDSNLTVGLVDSSETPITLSSGEEAYVTCNDSEYKFVFYATIPGGESDVTIDVVGNKTYSCSAWLENFAIQSESVAVASGSSTNLNLTSAPTQVTLSAILKDQNGTTLNLEGSIFADSLTELSSHYTSSVFVNGIADLSLVSGLTYGLYPYFNSNGSNYGILETSEGNFLVPTDLIEVQPSSGTSNQATVTLYRTDASVQVTLTDSNNNPLDGVWIALSDTSDSNRYISSLSDANGRVTLPVVGGRTYQVSAYPNSGLLAPASVDVTPQSGQTSTVSLIAPTPDYALNITTSATGAESGAFYCFAYTLDGAWSSSELPANLGETVALPLVRSLFNPAYVGCWGLGSDSAGEFKFYESITQLYLPVNGSSDSISVTLSASGDAISEQFTFQGGSAVSFNLGSGHTVDVPAGAFGNGKVTLSIRTTSAPNTGSDQPVLLFEITVTDENGLPLELQSGAIEFGLLVEEEDLPPGAELDDASGAFWDGDSYKPLPTEDTVSSSNAPSPFGISQIKKAIKAGSGAINRGKKLGLVARFAQILAPVEPEAPTNLRATVQKSGKVKVRWNDPAGADSCTLQITKKSKPNKVLFTKTVSAGTGTILTKKFPSNKYRAKLSCSNNLGAGPIASRNFNVADK